MNALMPCWSERCPLPVDDFHLPVKVDAEGRIWYAGIELPCALELPAGKRGFLVFQPRDVVLLLGPWGPDPRGHLLLSGRVSQIDAQGVVHVWLGRGLPEVVLESPSETAALLTGRPGQKVWLALATAHLAFSL